MDAGGVGCLFVLLAVVVVAVLVWWHGHQRALRAQEQARLDDERRRQLARDREAAEQADAATRFWLRMASWFPYLPKPEVEEPTAEAIYRAIVQLVPHASPFGLLSDLDLPVPPLSPAMRKRHLYIVGKTGSGKSTFLEHLIAEDMEEDRGVGVIGPEGEFFRDRLLPSVPAFRRDEVVYFAPGDSRNPITFNPLSLEPGDDPVRAAEDLFTIFRRLFEDDELGPRMQPMLQNAFSALVGRPGATLWDIKRIFEDAGFRETVIADADPYVRSFWQDTFPRFPKNADLPIINRLDRLLRPPVMRRTLCQPTSTLSIRRAIADGAILFLDLYGLPEENRSLFGQLLLSRFQIELMRRELSGKQGHQDFFLYADEFQSFAGLAEGTWRELLSRGRKYGLGLTLAHQHLSQLPTALQNEILGNVHSVVAFAISGNDAHIVRRSLLQHNDEREESEPVSAVSLVEQETGAATASLAGGKAVRLRTPPPHRHNAEAADAVIAQSWRRHGAPTVEATPPQQPPGQEQPGQEPQAESYWEN